MWNYDKALADSNAGSAGFIRQGLDSNAGSAGPVLQGLTVIISWNITDTGQVPSLRLFFTRNRRTSLPSDQRAHEQIPNWQAFR